MRGTDVLQRSSLIFITESFADLKDSPLTVFPPLSLIVTTHWRPIHLFPYLAFPLACPDPYSSNKQIECKISNRKNIRIQKINEGNIKLKQDVSILLFMPRIRRKLRAVVS